MKSIRVLAVCGDGVIDISRFAFMRTIYRIKTNLGGTEIKFSSTYLLLITIINACAQTVGELSVSSSYTVLYTLN